jgi:hypothetical protein
MIRPQRHILDPAVQTAPPPLPPKEEEEEEEKREKPQT